MTTAPLTPPYEYAKLRREMIEMAQRASAEIKMLRGVVSQLEPQAEAYRTLRQVLGLLPQQSQRMGEDLAWQLDRRVAALLTEEAPQKTSTSADLLPRDE